MPNEDKLTPSERRRLEALNQAIITSIHRVGFDKPSVIIGLAKQFDEWIKSGTVPTKEGMN